jgi:uncharacterized membrane protein
MKKPSNFKDWAVLPLGQFFILFGLPMLIGGIWLIVRGGSWQLLPAEIAFIVSGYLLLLRRRSVLREYAHPTALTHSKLLDMEDFEKRDDSSNGVNHLQTIDKLQAYALKAKNHTHIKKHGG